ncbi:MAG: 30S ribosomal protein S9 [Candidatus Lokiarchaeota archaeon]|nr:30S ribosomal protein S9 [Candidatus Lokiarchaeota archaeon]
MSKKKVYLENAKRKTSIAKAALKQDGTGRITINHVPYGLIPELIYREKVQELVDLIGPDNLKDIDISVTVVGGGRMSQISAARTAIARVFTDYRKSSALRAKLVYYDRTLLSGDARHTEPKKYGGRSARSRKQKSYR